MSLTKLDFPKKFLFNRKYTQPLIISHLLVSGEAPPTCLCSSERGNFLKYCIKLKLFEAILDHSNNYLFTLSCAPNLWLECRLNFGVYQFSREIIKSAKADLFFLGGGGDLGSGIRGSLCPQTSSEGLSMP